MSFAILDSSDMVKLLTDPKYIVLNFGDGDFFVYLETTYFRDERNREFETLIGPMMTAYGQKMSFWGKL